MYLDQAKRLAKRYSTKYLTFWYVRQVAADQFEPYAHDSGDAATVACFYCGRNWSNV